MKKFYLLLSVAVLMLAGCDKSPKDISDMKDPTPSDSMMYYFGEMQAYYYWKDAQTDTMLRSEDARAKFMEGFREGLKMESDDDAYNMGMQLGIRLAHRLKEFEERYNTDFKGSILAASMENNLKNDTMVDITEAQAGYYRIKDRLELGAAERELGDAKQKLARRGTEREFEMVNDTLYACDVTPPTTDANFKEGDRVAVQVTVSTIDGKEVVTRQFPDSITLGEGRVPAIVREAIYTMTDGQTRQFMTTPRVLLGKRYAAYKLPYDEPVVFTVKVHR